MPPDVWRQVVHNPRYEVSNRGWVRRMGANGWEIIKPWLSSVGYWTVNLRPENKKHSVHRLMAAAFFGPANGKEVNHRNGIKSDNWLTNLEYATRSENQLHRYRVLGHYISRDHRRRISAANSGDGQWRSVRPDIPRIMAMLKSGMTNARIADEMGLSPMTISFVRNGKHWTQREAQKAAVS